MSKKKIIAIVLFIFIGLFMFAFANPSEPELVDDGGSNTNEKVDNKDKNDKTDNQNDNQNNGQFVNNQVNNNQGDNNQVDDNQNDDEDSNKENEDGKGATSEEDNNVPTVTLDQKSVSLAFGTDYDFMTGVTIDADENAKIEVKVTNDENVALESDITNVKDLGIGTYTVTYTVTNPNGNSTSVTRTITVFADENGNDIDDETEEKYTLTINYIYARLDAEGNVTEEEASETYTEEMLTGINYSVESPVIEYYTVDKEVVEGTMGSEDVTEKVTYTPNNDENGDGIADELQHNLTINYVYSRGEEAKESYTNKYLPEATYRVESPVIEYYTVDKEVVEGTMGEEDIIVEVTYTPETDENQNGIADEEEYRKITFVDSIQDVDSFEDVVFYDLLDGLPMQYPNFVPERAGLTFAGWYTAEGEEAPSTVNGNATYEARWAGKYKVVHYYDYFNGNPPDVIVIDENRSGIVGSTVEVREEDKVYTTITGNNKYNQFVYVPQDRRNVSSGVVTKNGDLELRLYFSKKGENYLSAYYTVVFNSNNGKSSVLTQDIEYNKETKLYKNEFVYDGFAFMGWSTETNGNVQYANRAKVTNLLPYENYDNVGDGAEFNLFAIWGEDKNNDGYADVLEKNLTISYVYSRTDESGNHPEASASYTNLYLPGTGYSVDSPEIDYYTASESTVSGTMGDEDIDVTVIYTPETDENGDGIADELQSDLTINYVYSRTDENGNHPEASPSYNDKLLPGTRYSVNSPAIDYYTASEVTVSGVIGENDVEKTVIYTPETDENGDGIADELQNDLTISYVYSRTDENGNHPEASPSYNDKLLPGTSYSVNSPAIDYYTASEATVSGTMGDEDIDVTVIYSPKKDTNSNGIADEEEQTHKLRIIYVYQRKDDTGATIEVEAHTEYSADLLNGIGYSVDSPEINYYTADPSIVSGTMKDQDITEKVIYTPITDTNNNGIADEEEVTKYNIRFEDYNGSELATISVNEGYTPVYPNEDPTRAKTDTKVYVFDGWNNPLAPATSDTTYRATYKEYTIPTFKNKTKITYVFEKEYVLNQGIRITLQFKDFNNLAKNATEYNVTVKSGTTELFDGSVSSSGSITFNYIQEFHTIKELNIEVTPINQVDQASGETRVATLWSAVGIDIHNYINPENGNASVGIETTKPITVGDGYTGTAAGYEHTVTLVQK